MSDDDVANALRVEARRRALASIGEARSEADAAALLLALEDDDWRVRKEAVAVARARTGWPELVARLVEVLVPTVTHVGLRNAAVEVLAAHGAVAVDALASATPTLDADGRKLAAEALGATGEPASVFTLSALANDDDPNVRVAAVEALARLGPASLEITVPVLRRSLVHPDAFLRLAALGALDELSVALDWTTLAPLIADPLTRSSALRVAARAAHPQVAAALVDELARARGARFDEVTAALVDLLRASPDGEAAVRIALRGVPDVARTRLWQAASDTTGRSGSALVALAALADPRSSALAVAALADDDAVPAAELALQLLGARSVAALVDALESGLAPVEPVRLVELLGELSARFGVSSAALSALSSAFEAPAPEVVRVAALALGECGERDAFFVLAARSLDDPMVRSAVAAAAARLSARFPVDARALVQAAPQESASAFVAAVVARELGQRDDGALAWLRSLLSHPTPWLRRASLDALAALRMPGVLEAVRFALSDEELDVRVAAVRALGRLRDERGRAVGVELLIELVTSAHSEALVPVAVRALGDAGDERAVAVLAPLVAAATVPVAVAAVEALAALPVADQETQIGAALAHPDVEVVKAALAVLGERWSVTAAERALACLEHPARDVRRLVADLLGARAERASLEPLRRRLSAERDPLVREALEAAALSVESQVVPVRWTTPVPPRRSEPPR